MRSIRPTSLGARGSLTQLELVGGACRLSAPVEAVKETVDDKSTCFFAVYICFHRSTSVHFCGRHHPRICTSRLMLDLWTQAR